MTVIVNMEANSAQVESAIARLARQFRSTEVEARKVSQTVDGIGSKKSSNLDPTVRQLQQINASLQKTQSTIDKTLTGVTSSLKRAALTLGALFATGVLTKSLTSSTQAITQLENRIALVTGRTKELIVVQQELFAVSRRTGSSVESTAEIFNRFSLALQGSGKTNAEVIKVAETVQKAMSVSGASTASAAAAITQLGQGLSSGTLRGEELNSVLEQSPRIAKAIADELGITIGQLRLVAQEGALTSEVVYSALENQSAAIDADFAKTNKTISQYLLVLRDVVALRLSEIDSALGVSSGLIRKIDNITTALSNVSSDDVAGFKLLANFFRVTFKFAVLDSITVLGGFFNVFRAIFARIGKLYSSLLIPVKGIARELFAGLGKGLENLGNVLKPAIQGAASAIAEFFGLDLNKELADVFSARGALGIRKALDSLANEIEFQGFRWYNLGKRASLAITEIRYKLLDLYLSLDLSGGYFKNLGLFMTKPFYDMLKGVKEKVETTLAPILRFFKEFVTTIERGFFWLYDKVVGNSWWPDMLTRIEETTDRVLPSVVSKFNSFRAQISSVFKSLFEKTQSFNLEATISFSQDSFGIIKTKIGEISGALTATISSFWQAFSASFPQLSQLISAAVFTGVLAIASPDSYKLLSSFFQSALVIGLLAGVSAFASEDILDSGFFNDIGASLGQAVGAVVTTIISAIPEITRALFQVVSSFGSAFLNELGVIGRFINGLATLTGTQGIISVILFGVGIQAILGNFKAIGATFSGILTLFSGASIGGVGVGKKGKTEGLLGYFLLGDGRGVLAGIAAVYSAVTIIPNLLNGEFGLAATGLGLIPLFLFGAGGTASIILDTLKTIGKRLGLTFAGKSLFDKASLVQDIAEVGNAFTDLKGKTTLGGIVSSFGELGEVIKRAALTVATDLAPSFARVGAFVGPALSAVSAQFTAFMVRLKLRAAALGGPLGAVGTGMFGKFAKGAAVLAGFLALFTGVANAADSSVSSLVAGFSVYDLGALGLMFFGAGGADGLLTKVGSVGKKLGGKLLTSIGGAFLRIGAVIGASVIGGILAAGSGILAAILAFILSPIVLVGAAIVGGGLALYWLFGSESDQQKEISKFRAKAQALKTELEDTLSQESVTDVLTESAFNIDLKALLDVSSFEGLSERQLSNVKVAMATFNKVIERNNAILQDEGQLSRAAIQESTKAANDLAAALAKTPDVSQDTEVVSGLRESIIAVLKDNVKTSIAEAGFSDLYLRKENKGDKGTAISDGASPAVQNLARLLNAFDTIDFSRVDPKIANQFVDGLSEYLVELEKTQATGFLGFKTPGLRESISAAETKLDKEIAPKLEQLAVQLGISLGRALDGAKYEKEITETLTAATTLGLSGLDEGKLLKLGETAFLQLRARLLTAAQDPKLTAAAGRKLGSADDGTGKLATGPLDDAVLNQLAELQAAVTNFTSQIGVVTSTEISNYVTQFNEQLNQLGADFQIEKPLDLESYQKGKDLLFEMSKAQEELNVARANLDFSKEAELLATLAAGNEELLLTLGTTEQKLESISGLVGGLPDINSALALDPALIQLVIDYANEIRGLLALLRGGLGALPGADFRQSPGEAATSRIEELRNKAQEIFSGDTSKLPSYKTPATAGGGGGGGGEEAAKTWLEEFKEGLSKLDLNIDDDILAGLNVDVLNSLTSLSGKYLAAQEALNNSAMSEVELRKESLKLMQATRAEAINALNDGTFGGAKAALESADASISDDVLGRLNAASASYAIALATRIEQLELERNTLALGSAAALAATNNIALMKTELEQLTSSSTIMRDAFKDGLNSFLKGQSSFKEFAEGLLDTFTSTIIEKFSTGLTDGLFNSLGLDNLFSKLFGGAEKLGGGLGGLAGGLQPGATPANPLWTKSADPTALLGGLGGGKSGGGGGIFGFLGGLFGFASGGKVAGAGTGTSDSILAKLSNGEFVVNAQATKEWLPVLNAINSNKGGMPAFANGGMVGPANYKAVTKTMSSAAGKSQQTFQINITGDVSDQTRREIIKMLPEISSGVSMVNRERGSR